MKSKKVLALFILLLASSVLSTCSYPATSSNSTTKEDSIRITDIKTATTIDESLMPVQPQEVFSKSTSSVYCWFKWRNARVGTVIVAKWHYVTDDIPILDNAIVIPRKEGMGSVSLAMPEGKTLPPGLYRIILTLGKRPLRSLSFKISAEPDAAPAETQTPPASPAPPVTVPEPSTSAPETMEMPSDSPTIVNTLNQVTPEPQANSISMPEPTQTPAPEQTFQNMASTSESTQLPAETQTPPSEQVLQNITEPAPLPITAENQIISENQTK